MSLSAQGQTADHCAWVKGIAYADVSFNTPDLSGVLFCGTAKIYRW
ncbi:MAG: hypothetical protein ACRER3_24080 [Pseudomonas fluorescens]